MLPIWLFVSLTIGAPLLWLIFDHLQQKTARAFSDRPRPLRAATSDLA
jgi:hypothetical protein